MEGRYRNMIFRMPSLPYRAVLALLTHHPFGRHLCATRNAWVRFLCKSLAPTHLSSKFLRNYLQCFRRIPGWGFVGWTWYGPSLFRSLRKFLFMFFTEPAARYDARHPLVTTHAKRDPIIQIKPEKRMFAEGLDVMDLKPSSKTALFAPKAIPFHARPTPVFVLTGAANKHVFASNTTLPHRMKRPAHFRPLLSGPVFSARFFSQIVHI